MTRQSPPPSLFVFLSDRRHERKQRNRAVVERARGRREAGALVHHGLGPMNGGQGGYMYVPGDGALATETHRLSSRSSLLPFLPTAVIPIPVFPTVWLFSERRPNAQTANKQPYLPASEATFVLLCLPCRQHTTASESAATQAKSQRPNRDTHAWAHPWAPISDVRVVRFFRC